MIKTGSPALQTGGLPSKPPGKPMWSLQHHYWIPPSSPSLICTSSLSSIKMCVQLFIPGSLLLFILISISHYFIYYSLDSFKLYFSQIFPNCLSPKKVLTYSWPFDFLYTFCCTLKFFNFTHKGQIYFLLECNCFTRCVSFCCVTKWMSYILLTPET